MKFSFAREIATNAALLREKITAVEVVGPWPDCLPYDGTPVFATAGV